MIMITSIIMIIIVCACVFVKWAPQLDSTLRTARNTHKWKTVNFQNEIAHQNRHIRLNLTKHMHSHSLHCQNSATVCLRRNEQNSENRKNSQKFQHHFKLLSLRCFSSRLESRQRPLLCWQHTNYNHRKSPWWWPCEVTGEIKQKIIHLDSVAAVEKAPSGLPTVETVSWYRRHDTHWDSTTEC